MERVTNWKIVLGVVVVLVLSNGLARLTVDHVRASERLRTAEVEAAKESIALSLLGQVQFTVGSLMWMKTMEYLHNGVPYRPPTQAEEERGLRSIDSVGVSEGLAHKEGIPVTLTRKSDWRGFVGELHREIVPYMVEHRHSDPRELIPWYKLATKFNPNLERLYVLGAFFMTDFAGEPDEALAYLTTGAEANPWSFEVHAALGRLYHDSFQDYENAINVLQKAVELGKRERARLSKNKENFDDYQKQLFRESYLFWAKGLTELGRYDEALQVCEEGLAETKNNNLLNVQKRIIERRKAGENVTETATVTRTTQSTLASGNRDFAGDEEQDALYDLDDEDDAVGEIRGVYIGAIVLAICVLLVALLAIYANRKQLRILAQNRVFVKKALLATSLSVILLALAIIVFHVVQNRERTFASPKEKATYLKDHLSARARKIAPWLIAAGDYYWERAGKNAPEETNADVEKLYARAAQYYQAALDTATAYGHRREIAFPSGISLGKVSTRRWGSNDAWESLGEAQGVMSIPPKHEVDLSISNPITTEKLQGIAALGPTAIQSLNLGESLFDDEGMEALRGLTGLRHVSLYNTRISDKGLQTLSEIACGIEALNLGKTKISDVGIKTLKHFPRLRKLSLAEVNISDKGIKDLAEISTLRMLWLSGTPVDNDGLQYISRLQDLRILWLGNKDNLITDEGLSYLKTMASLRELWIASDAITEQGLLDLRSALTACRILDRK